MASILSDIRYVDLSLISCDQFHCEFVPSEAGGSMGDNVSLVKILERVVVIVMMRQTTMLTVAMAVVRGKIEREGDNPS